MLRNMDATHHRMHWICFSISSHILALGDVMVKGEIGAFSAEIV
jgi:hypothetical protein